MRPTDEPDHPAVVVSLSTLVVTLLTPEVLRAHSPNQTGETERQPVSSIVLLFQITLNNEAFEFLYVMD